MTEDVFIPQLGKWASELPPGFRPGDVIIKEYEELPDGGRRLISEMIVVAGESGEEQQ